MCGRDSVMQRRGVQLLHHMLCNMSFAKQAKAMTPVFSGSTHEYRGYASRSLVANRHLQKGRQMHRQLHCVQCCHHTAASYRKHSTYQGQERLYGQAPSQRVGALSFLQAPCQGLSATERYLPYEWSLKMRVLASWKAYVRDSREVGCALHVQLASKVQPAPYRRDAYLLLW